MRVFSIAAAFALTALGAEQYKVIPDVEYSRPGGFGLKLDAHIPPGTDPFQR